MTINFKPYLIFTVVPHILKRRWTAFEGSIIAIVVIYLVSWAIVGSGTPIEIAQNIMGYDLLPIENKFDNAFYQMTYKPLLDSFKSRLPLMFYLGSEPIRWVELIVPVLIRGGQIGIAACFVGAAIRPNAIAYSRLVLFGVLLTTTASMTGGYTQILVFFLVFMEKWQGPSRIIALVMAYLLSISVDYQIMSFVHETLPSYLSGRTVGVDLGATVGEFVRPGVVLILEYALIVGSLLDVLRELNSGPKLMPGGGSVRRQTV